MNVELMKKVRERVLAEPHRVNMVNWIAYKDKRAMRMLRKALGMSCKTTCCIAGHIIEVAGGDVIPHRLICVFHNSPLYFLDVIDFLAELFHLFFT